MKMKEILDKLADDPKDRKRFSIYVSERVYREFSKLVGAKRSRALEELMRLYIKGAKAKGS